jgi:hypothetical protein
LKTTVTAALLLVLLCANAQAQSCSTSGISSTLQSCNALLEGALILGPRVAVGLAGGNPVPGASSTLGMRIRSVPRVTVSARVTGINVDLPNDKSFAHSINLDAAVGVFSGFTLVPTIGGFGSVDVVASAGKMQLSDAASAQDPASWALGVRLGLLRESFTAPGVSVTGMYRNFGDMTWTSATATGNTNHRDLRDNTAWSVRGVVGKRLFILGANAGLGYDSFKSNVNARIGGAELLTVGTAQYANTETMNRATAFANVSWTMLILNLVAEGGYQKGGDAYTGSLPAGQSSKTQNKGYYGSLAVRLAL